MHTQRLAGRSVPFNNVLCKGGVPCSACWRCLKASARHISLSWFIAVAFSCIAVLGADDSAGILATHPKRFAARIAVSGEHVYTIDPTLHLRQYGLDTGVLKQMWNISDRGSMTTKMGRSTPIFCNGLMVSATSVDWYELNHKHSLPVSGAASSSLLTFDRKTGEVIVANARTRIVLTVNCPKRTVQRMIAAIPWKSTHCAAWNGTLALMTPSQLSILRPKEGESNVSISPETSGWGAIADLTFSGDGSVVAACSEAGDVMVVRVSDAAILATTRTLDSATCIDATQTHTAVGLFTGIIHIIEHKTGQALELAISADESRVSVSDVFFIDSVARIVLVALDDGSLCKVDLETKNVLWRTAPADGYYE